MRISGSDAIIVIDNEVWYYVDGLPNRCLAIYIFALYRWDTIMIRVNFSVWKRQMLNCFGTRIDSEFFEFENCSKNSVLRRD